MAKIEERQLLITAKLKDGTTDHTFGYGLPYPLPIENPVWVGMKDIIAAQANGYVEITIHNLDTPVVLNEALYNKLYDLGYVTDEIVKEVEKENKASEKGPAEKETEKTPSPSHEEGKEESPETESEEGKGKKNKKSKSE